MRWGDVDYKQLQKLRDNLQKLQDMDLDKFCEDVSKELAAPAAGPGHPPHPGGAIPPEQRKKGRHSAPGLDRPGPSRRRRAAGK